MIVTPVMDAALFGLGAANDSLSMHLLSWR
jgi:hypothetical protein